MTQDTITISDGLIVAATIIGPIIAVQAQKWVERYREARSQKLAVFSTLMTTRATRVAPDHVRALNTIDIVFRKNRAVIDHWRDYQDALSPINQTTEEKFIDLLYEMSANLGFDFDKVMLRRVVYLPQGHVDAQAIQADVQKNLGLMLKVQHEIQSGMLEYLQGRKSLKVIIDKDDVSSR